MNDVSAETRTLRLGLIGDNIRASRAPELHRIAGGMLGLTVSYDLMIPRDLGLDFDATFARCVETLDGFNVTLPYKERAVARCRIADPMIARIGSINTVRVGPDGPEGFNTDYSGFVAAYRGTFGEAPPGVVALIGGGGVGKAVAFGLLALGAAEIRVADPDTAKADGLANALRAAGTGCAVTVYAKAGEAARGADGVVNCTPLGMVGYPGSPLEDADFTGCRWGFDAVYTPVDTEFRAQGARAGVTVMSGYELFFFQGVHAFRIFAGRDVPDEAELRRRLAEGGSAP